MPFKFARPTAERVDRIVVTNLETKRRQRANDFLRALGLPPSCGVDPHEWYARRREALPRKANQRLPGDGM